VDFNKICPQDFWQIPFWWQRFMEDENYRSKLRCRWKELRQTSLSGTRVDFLIDSVVNLTAEARQRHFARWPVLGQYIWPNPQPIATTYDGEISYLKTWMNDRLDWIDNHIPNDGLCYDYPATIKESVMIQGMPNPVKNNYQLVVRSRMAQALYINVTDVTGRLLYNETRNIQAGYNSFTVNMSNWSAGIYMLQLTAASGEKITEKLLKD
jgi:hypothetical protein